MNVDADELINVAGRYDALHPNVTIEESVRCSRSSFVPCVDLSHRRSQILQQAIESSEFEGSTTVEVARKELGLEPGAPARFKGMADHIELLPYQLVRSAFSMVTYDADAHTDWRDVDGASRTEEQGWHPFGRGAIERSAALRCAVADTLTDGPGQDECASAPS